MSEQRALFDVPPATLTDRQAAALTHLQAAGHEGLRGADLGRLMGSGPLYAKTTGLELLRTLKRKGHARQAKGGLWVALTLENETGNDSFGDIPY